MKTLVCMPGLFALAALVLICRSPAATLHVKPDGSDAASGSSWTQAKRTVTNAIAATVPGDSIWVAAGRYPERIVVRPGTALLGGFSGTESALEQRDWRNHFSILDGATNGAVVTVSNAGPDTRIDGFMITGGLAIHGGGIKVIGSAPVIANNRITGNITDGAGAGISIWGFQILTTTTGNFPVITNNVIVSNQSINDEGDGGGIAVIGSSPLIAGNVIARNTATRNGGGIACWRHSLPLIANNVIESNSASYDENTVSVGGGGIFASATDLDGRPIAFAVSAPRIANNVVAANGARSGAGIAVIDSRLGAASIRNNTLAANNGSAIFWANTRPTNDNNLVAFNTLGFERGLAGTDEAVIRFNNVFGNTVLGVASNYRNTPDRTGSDGNLSAEPRLANRSMREFHLQPDSPCRDRGSVELIEPDLPDIDGELRILGPAVDIGADESTGLTWNVPTPVIHVSPSGNGGDGRTWATARQTVADGIALAASLRGGEVRVAMGTYREHIELPASILLRGGFAGGDSNPGERDPARYPSILDGGGIPTLVYVRNAGYRLSEIDGFTLQNGGLYTGGNPGHADLTVRRGGRGAGIYCRVSGPIIRNNLIRTNSIGSPYNSFEAYGGGFYGYLAHAQIQGNTFTENEVLNRTDGNGGAIYLNESMPDIESNTFLANHARNGAAIYGWRSAPRIAKNLIERNSWYNSYPLPVYFGSVDGAIALHFSPDLIIDGNTIRGNVAAFGAGINLANCVAGRVINNVITDNRSFDPTTGVAGWGGGIYCMVNQNATNLLIAHNTLAGNSAPGIFGAEYGGAIAATVLTNSLTVANNILAWNSSGIWRHPGSAFPIALQSNCLFNSNSVNYIHLAAHPTDLVADPRFANRPDHDYHLTAESPCLDRAAPSFAPPFDHDLLPRPLDGNADGLAAPDPGAFEFNPADRLPRFLEVRVEAGRLLLTWNDAGRGMTLQRAATLANPIWEALPGTEASTSTSVPVDAGTAYFRLLKR